MALIDLVITDKLKQSTNPRGSVPDGNVYFNPDGSLELITVEELATVDFGSGPVANPLSNEDGVTMRAIFAFERQERSADEELRKLERWIDGKFKRAGAYWLINGREFSTTGSLSSDILKIRKSGFAKYTGTNLNEIYFGVRSLGNIETTSQPYYQLSAEGSSVNFNFLGAVKEAVKVFGDATHGNFDSTAYLSISVRSWGFVHDRKTIEDSGLSDAHAYAAGISLGESPNAYNTGFTKADVFGGAQVAPWTGMVFSSLDTARTESGFVGGTADFSFQITNSGNGTLAELVAYMDALAMEAADVDAHATNTWQGKDKNVLYTLNAQGKVVLMQGLFLENVPVADRTNVIFVDDLGASRTYESVAGGSIIVGDAAAADTNAWYHMFYADPPGVADEFNTIGAVTVNDASGTPIKGLVGGVTSIPFDFAYDSNVQAGFTAGTDRPIVIEVEGNGGCTAKRIFTTITNSTSLQFACEPDFETNI